MSLKKILKQSLITSWRYKYLWFFGLFAALLGSNNEFEILSGSLTGEIKQGYFLDYQQIIEKIFSRDTISGISKIITEDPLSLILLVVIGLVILTLFLFLVWLTIVSQAALVNNSSQIIKGKDHSFQAGTTSGINNFWPVFALNIISKIVIFLTFGLLGLSVIVTNKPIYLITFIILIPIAVIFSFIIKYAVAYVVIYGSRLLDSFKSGWRLFVSYWIISIKMALLLFIITLLVGFILVIIIANLNTIFTFLTVVFAKSLPAVGFWLFVVIRSLFAFLLIILVGTFLTTWQITAWTNLFLKLVNGIGNKKTTVVKK